MQYRRIGTGGLKVSAVSIGGWLTFGGSVDDSSTSSILKRAVDEGVNFVDLADVYAKGEAEKVAGKTLSKFKRTDLVISSKVYFKTGDGPNDRGLSRKHVMESVERSLKNLRTDYLDVYFCHREDPETPLEETARAMDDLVRAGKVLYWGTSMWKAESLRRAHEIADRRHGCPPSVEQPRYSLVKREIEADVLPTAAELGMGLVVWSPLGGGLLTGKYNDGVPKESRGATSDWLAEDLNETTLDRVRTMCGIASELGLTPGQLALAWCLARPEVSSVITGATRPGHVKENVRAADVELAPEIRAKLDALFPAAPATA